MHYSMFSIMRKMNRLLCNITKLRIAIIAIGVIIPVTIIALNNMGVINQIVAGVLASIYTIVVFALLVIRRSPSN